MAGLFRPDRARAVELPGNVIDTTSPGIHTDMLLTSPQRIPHARHLVATAFALALVNDGWKLHSPPGKFYLENDGKQIQPFQLHSERSGCSSLWHNGAIYRQSASGHTPSPAITGTHTCSRGTDAPLVCDFLRSGVSTTSEDRSEPTTCRRLFWKNQHFGF